MRYLFKHWEELKVRLAKKNFFLFLDYDGTLAPIVETPGKAIFSKENKLLLKRLSKKPNFKLAIISGRALNDIRNIVGLNNIIYAGNHGLEIKGQGSRIWSPVPQAVKPVLQRIRDTLKKRCSGIEGAFVEDKGLTLSLHYRLVKGKNISTIKSIFNETLKPYLSRKEVRISRGKKVFEVRPPIEWDKGEVVLWLLERQYNTMPIYIGDDITDEDAFKELKDRGLSIFVGMPKRSNAEYYLKNTREVTEFLERIYGTV